ncbi:MAG: VOC family protein [Bdellovibrionia bacterium]
MNKTYGTMYYVDDMAKTVSFYKKLGLKPGYESPEWTEFEIGGHNLCLHAKRAAEKYSDGGVLILSADGIKNLHKQMKGDGIKVDEPHEVHPGSWTFHFRDVSGNELSLYGAP